MSTNSKAASSNKSSRNLFSWIFWITFLLVVVLITLLMALEAQPLVSKSLPVFKNRVLFYHLITKDDVVMKAFNWNDGSADTVSNMSSLIGYYTLDAIDANKPINKSQIGPKLDTVGQNLIMKTLAVAIPANSAMPVGGPVHAGDIVSVAAVPLPDKTSGSAGPPVVVFDKVLVLDVNTVGNQTVTLLAIPSSSWLDYLAKTRNATIVLSYPVG
jgi:Flp pilus assembly protein CpaB